MMFGSTEENDSQNQKFWMMRFIIIVKYDALNKEKD